MGSSNAHAVLNAALALHAQDNGLAPVHLVYLGARLQLVAEFVKGQEPGSPRLVQCLGSGLSLGFAVIEEVLVPLAKSSHTPSSASSIKSTPFSRLLNSSSCSC